MVAGVVAVTAKSPTDGEWWRLVEINSGMDLARYLTIQYEGYRVEEYRPDWALAYAHLWVANKSSMELGTIGDSYSPWREGRPSL